MVHYIFRLNDAFLIGKKRAGGLDTCGLCLDDSIVGLQTAQPNLSRYLDGARVLIPS